MPQGTITTAAWFPPDCTIKIEEKGTGTVQTVTAQVTNISDGGGAKNSDSIPHFGNAYVTVKKPQDQYEVSMEITVHDTTWSQILTNTATSVANANGSTIEVVSGGAQNNYKIRVEWTDPLGSSAYKIAYYNALGVTFEKSSSADDRLVGTITFNVAPTNNLGSGQKYEWETSNRYDAGIGSALTGSYGAYEKTADVLFGYSPGSMI